MERRLVWGRRVAVPVLFAVLALAFVGRGLLPGRALLPIDNLFLYPPWQAHAAEFGVLLPHNALLGDAILQNYSWKRFIAASYAAGQFPLWNPYILAGQPFLASAQNGSLYPPGVLFSVLPLGQAYGWFIGVHLWLGALFAYLFARTLGARRLGGVVAGITFGFCGYLVVSFLWPMVVSTAIWLPALLAILERMIRGAVAAAPIAPDARPPATSTGFNPTWVALAALVVALQFLAGHLEMSLYLLITAGLYTAVRLLDELRRRAHVVRVLAVASAALLAVGLGSALAAVQLVPFAEVIGANVRGGWSDYGETIGYALPRDRALGFLVPDYFGNPSHHTYLDLLDGQVRSVAHARPNGEPRTDTEWGGKNYVEGTVYVGVLPLLLAGVGVAAQTRGSGAVGAVALVALLLAFGTPLYALLFYGIPGVNQLHTPFRWIYPFSLCAAILAGLGADALCRAHACSAGARWGRRLGLVAVLLGGTLVVGLLLLLPVRDTAAELAGRLPRRWPELRQGFSEARVLFSYTYLNLLGAGCLLALAGALLWRWSGRRSRLLASAAVALIVGDLFSFGVGFNTVASTSPLEFVPSAIQAIPTGNPPSRIMTLGEDDTLPANTGMLFGLHDARGYDTIILREYVEYLELIEPQRGIQYSKVAKLFDPRSLSSPLLDLLNVEYILTTRTVSQPGYALLREADGIRVYRNERAMPRAHVVAAAQPASDHTVALRAVGAPAFDPRRVVVLEGWDGSTQTGGEPGSAEIVRYENNRVDVRASAPGGGFLVLADVFFPGWVATLDGAERPILRANGLFRAIELPPGNHEVVFRYSPLSFRVGAFVSFLAALGLGLLGAVASWRLVGSPDVAASAARRVVRNSGFPMVTGLLNKAADFGFALVMFRILQAEGIGAYTFAGVLVGYFDILVGFGLGTLITREVARDHAAARRYLGNALALRLVLWLGSVGLAAVLVGPLAGGLGITPPLALTIWLLVAALLPGILSGTISALFMARERMDAPAVVTVLTTLLKVSLGLVALLGGWGYVGLAGVSVLTNVLTAAVLVGLYARTFGWPGLELDFAFQPRLARTSLPLLVNSLLNTLFFRIDAVLLKPIAGDLALGWYSTAYKFIDGLQIIPSSFVLAVFPLLSRHAAGDRARLTRVCSVALKALLVLALPIAVGTTILAEPIILLLAGPSYLPEAARALQVLIWFLPFSFVNGLTQYILIALDRQRAITAGFVIGTAFNLTANLLLIPTYGYLAASAVTVASELVLLVPFWRVIQRELPDVSLARLGWRPASAALIMAGPVWLAAGVSSILAILVGALAYGVALVALRALDADDWAMLRGLVKREARLSV